MCAEADDYVTAYAALVAELRATIAWQTERIQTLMDTNLRLHERLRPRREGVMRTTATVLLFLLVATPVWAANPSTVSWLAGPFTPANAPTSYTAKCGTAPGGPYPLTGTVTGTPPPVTMPVTAVVTAPGEYFCVVTASNQAGESGPSNEANFRLQTAPNPPASLQVK